jgi:hypothetical protein
MVSVETQSAYWLPLRANLLTSFFLDFLEEKPGLVPPVLNPSDTDSVVCNLLTYVRRADAAAALSLYEKLIVRQVRSDSEWIHNDYLIFSLICAVRKFQLNSDWVRQILRSRPNSELTQRLINKSFDNILAGNDNAKEDYHQISVVYQLVTQQVQFDAERLHKMFAYLWRHPFPYFESEFLNIVSLRAIRGSFEAKGLLNPEEFFAAEKFTERFLTRTRILATIMVTVPVLLLILGLAIATFRYPDNFWVKGALALSAAFGVDVLASFSSVQGYLRKVVTTVLRHALGYSPPAPVLQKQLSD